MTLDAVFPAKSLSAKNAIAVVTDFSTSFCENGVVQKQVTDTIAVLSFFDQERAQLTPIKRTCNFVAHKE